MHNKVDYIIAGLALAIFILIGIIGGLVNENTTLSLQNQSLIEEVSDYKELVDVMESNRSK